MLNAVASVLLLIFIALSSLVFFVGALIIWLLTVALDPRRRLLHLYACLWASVYVWLTPYWRVRYQGRELVDPAQTYVIVSNHQSLLDILIAFGLFIHFKWVSKIEIFRVPVIGWNMVLNDYIPLKRGDKQSIQEMMAHCERHLRSGSSVFMFPEGTRSPNGQLKAFKVGAFELAKRLQLPILPVVIAGTTRALPKKSLILTGRHEISLKVLPCIEPEIFAEMSSVELAELTHQCIAAELGQDRIEKA